MLKENDVISEVTYDEELQVVIVRTKRKTNYEKKLEKKIRTSGCAVGTVYGDIMNDFSSINLSKKTKIKTSWIYSISKKVNNRPSLYLKAGALHGCVLCKKNSPLIYVEDVGRHNAIDKIAGWLFLNKEDASDKIFYTTGRLTSEMIIKTVQMGIPILISRSGFTESGVALAKQAGLTLIGRAKGKRMIIANGIERVVFDSDIKSVKNEDVISAQRSIISWGNEYLKNIYEIIPCVIIAGGKGKRLGGKEKALINLLDRPLISYIIEKVSGKACLLYTSPSPRD